MSAIRKALPALLAVLQRGSPSAAAPFRSNSVLPASRPKSYAFWDVNIPRQVSKHTLPFIFRYIAIYVDILFRGCFEAKIRLSCTFRISKDTINCLPIIDFSLFFGVQSKTKNNPTRSFRKGLSTNCLQISNCLVSNIRTLTYQLINFYVRYISK